MLYLKQLEVGLMRNFNYLIGDTDTHECAIVDPAWEPDRLLQLAKQDGMQVKHILLTHNHFDHIEGVAHVVAATGADIYINPLDEKPVLRQGKMVRVSDGMEFKLGTHTVTAIHTPGHTPGSTCYLVDGRYLATGDTLFQGNCGRCDLPGGDPRALFKSLQELKALDPATKVYPGHDYGTRPVTSIGYEKQHNPVLQGARFEDFLKVP